MSCYKELVTEDRELRDEVTMLSIAIQGLIDALEDVPDWVSIDEQLHLSSMPIRLPF